MYNNLVNLIITGPPGTGKTTQAKLLAEKLNLNLVDTGSLLRENSQTALGKEAKEFTDKGLWAPEEILSHLLKEYIETKCDPSKGFVFAGFPRTLDQIPFMENELKIEADKVFNMNVNPEEFMKRLEKRAELEHRSDETPEAIMSRLSEHGAKAEPVIAYFRAKGLVEDINGERSIEDIHLDIMNRFK